MKREDIKELYSIDTEDGTLILIKRDIDTWLKRKHKYGYVPDMFVNPKIIVQDNGTLTISGPKHTFFKVRTTDDWSWLPTPFSEMNEGWEDMMFYSNDDIFKKDVIEYKGFMWPFKKRIVHKDVDHVGAGYYLSTKGQQETLITSNYRLTGFKAEKVKGII